MTLPDPAPGVGASLERRFGEHTTLTGARSVDVAGFGRRTIRLSWERLTDAEYAVLETIFSGAAGFGPWLLLTDDTGWNYLSGVQAAATAATWTTAGWTVATGERLDSAQPATGPAPHGGVTLGWSLPAPTTVGRLTPQAPTGLSGWPALDATPWSFAALVRTEGTATVTASAALTWVDGAAESLPAMTGTSLPVTASAWVALTVSAAPPVGAVAVVPEVRVTPASVTAASVVYVDAPRLELGAPAAGWLPGRGLPLVSMTALSDRYPWAGWHDAEATFLEVG